MIIRLINRNILKILTVAFLLASGTGVLVAQTYSQTYYATTQESTAIGTTFTGDLSVAKYTNFNNGFDNCAQNGCAGNIGNHLIQAGLNLAEISSVVLLEMKGFTGNGPAQITTCPQSNFGTFDTCVVNTNDGNGNHVLFGVRTKSTQTNNTVTASLPQTQSIVCSVDKTAVEVGEKITWTLTDGDGDGVLNKKVDSKGKTTYPLFYVKKNQSGRETNLTSILSANARKSKYSFSKSFTSAGKYDTYINIDNYIYLCGEVTVYKKGEEKKATAEQISSACSAGKNGILDKTYVFKDDVIISSGSEQILSAAFISTLSKVSDFCALAEFFGVNAKGGEIQIALDEYKGVSETASRLTKGVLDQETRESINNKIKNGESGEELSSLQQALTCLKGKLAIKEKNYTFQNSEINFIGSYQTNLSTLADSCALAEFLGLSNFNQKQFYAGEIDLLVQSLIQFQKENNILPANGFLGESSIKIIINLLSDNAEQEINPKIISVDPAVIDLNDTSKIITVKFDNIPAEDDIKNAHLFKVVGCSGDNPKIECTTPYSLGLSLERYSKSKNEASYKIISSTVGFPSGSASLEFYGKYQNLISIGVVVSNEVKVEKVVVSVSSVGYFSESGKIGLDISPLIDSNILLGAMISKEDWIRLQNNNVNNDNNTFFVALYNGKANKDLSVLPVRLAVPVDRTGKMVGSGDYFAVLFYLDPRNFEDGLYKVVISNQENVANEDFNGSGMFTLSSAINSQVVGGVVKGDSTVNLDGIRNSIVDLINKIKTRISELK